MSATVTNVVFLLGIVLALTGAAVMAHGSIFGDRTTPAAITIVIIGLSLIATSRKKRRGSSRS